MNKFCPGNGSCGSSGCQCVHPVPSSEKEAFVCSCWMSRSVNGYTTQRNPECPYHGDTPSAPTPGEDWEKEFEDRFVGNVYDCIPHRHWKEMKGEVFSWIRSLLLSSHASKAREEGLREGYEVGYTKAQIDLKADDEIIGAEPCGGGCNGYKRAGASHCAFIGCGSRPDSQTNPKKE